MSWAVPLVMLALLFTFVLLVLGVRTRRASANLGMLAFFIALGALSLVTASRFLHHDVYTASYEWLNLQVASSGSVAFQNWVLDLDLRIDHVAIAEAGVILATAFLILAWSRSGARAEPGVPRLHILVVMFVLGAVGVALTPNLIGLLAYWGVAAGATYLLMSNRWGTPDTASGRAALALPVAGDLSIFAGAGLLYSRYGELDLGRLPALLHSTPGAGLKSLTAACVLIVAGAGVRAGAPPFLAWLNSVAEGPPAAVALIQGVWGLLAVGLVFRILPLIHQAGPQAALALGIAGALAAVLAPLAALLAGGLRRALTATGVGSVGLAFIVLAYGDSARALTGVLASAPLRAGMLLAGASIVAAMRTEDLAEMGAALRRMRWSAVTLLLGAIGLGLAYVEGGAAGLKGLAWQVLFAVGLALVPFAGLRAYLLAAHGTLERRRSFEPGRVRDAQSPLRQLALGLSVFGGLFVVLSVVNRWLVFLDAATAHRPTLVLSGEYLAAVLVGVLLAAATFGRARAVWTRRSATLAARTGAAIASATLAFERLVGAPLRRAATAVDSRSVELEADALTPLTMAGRVVNRAADADLPLGWIGLAAAVAGVAAILAALLSPGVIR